jgi:MFS family permease
VRLGAALAAAGLSFALIFAKAEAALTGFALVGVGFATIVPMVFSAAGRMTSVAPGIALASVTTLGYLGFLTGPPFIGFAAELFGLRCALGIIVVTSLVAVTLAASLRQTAITGRHQIHL